MNVKELKEQKIQQLTRLSEEIGKTQQRLQGLQTAYAQTEGAINALRELEQGQEKEEQQ
jgi:prefoldin subunit 5